MTRKDDLIAQFDQLFEAVNTALANVDPDAVLHPDSGWRVHDVLGHLAVWYGERVKCLRAYQQDKEYRIPDFDMQMFNHDSVAERRNRPYAEIQAEWRRVHADLIAELDALPASSLGDEIMFPWGVYGPINTLLGKLVEHAEEHLAEFRGAAD